MLLGFMRTEGFPGAGIGAAPALIVLVAGLFATGRLPALEAHELFRAAVVCTAAGFLLDPVLSPVAPDAEQLLAGVGATLFEIVVWTTSAIIVGSCGKPAGVPLRRRAWQPFQAICWERSSPWRRQPSATRFPRPRRRRRSFSCSRTWWGCCTCRATKRCEASCPRRSAPAKTRVAAQARPRRRRRTALRRARATSRPRLRPLPPIRARPQPRTRRPPVLERPCALVAEACGLTPRETEVLEQLAQGRDLAFMEERFTISRNTIRCTRSACTPSWACTSKQELIDLVDSVRERERFAEGDR